MVPDDRLKKEGNKWLRHSDPRIAFEAFKLASAYLFGKTVQAVAGEELAPPIKIDNQRDPEIPRESMNELGSVCIGSSCRGLRRKFLESMKD